MYNYPDDKSNELSSLDIFLAFFPYINFIVSISYLVRLERRKRGLKLLGISLIVNGLCSIANRLLFVRVSDLPFLAWHKRISWKIPADWWIWIILVLVIASFAIRWAQGRRLALNWQALARRNKLEYKPGGCLGFSRRARIAGFYRERKLSLYTYHPYLIDNIIDQTRLELTIANRSNLHMCLEHMPI